MASPIGNLINKHVRVEDFTEWVTILDALLANGRASEPEFRVKARFLDGKDDQDLYDMTRIKGGVDVDTKRSRKLRSRRLVVDWSGLTVGNLKRICPKLIVDNDEAFLADLGASGREIPYSEEMALLIYDHSDATDYSLRIINEMKDIAQRQATEQAKERKEMEGNFGSSSRSDSA